MLSIETEHGDLSAWDGDAIVVNLFEGVRDPGGATGAVDAALDGAISALIETGDFDGSRGQTRVLYATEGVPADRVVVVGLGDPDAMDGDAVRSAAGASVNALSDTQARRAATVVHGAGVGGLDPAEAARAVAVGAVSREYGFDRKTDRDEEDEGSLDALVLVEFDEEKLAGVERGARKGAVVANAQNFVRDVASVSGEEADPSALAGTVERVAEQAGVAVEVRGPDGIDREQMGGVIAVSKGSDREPRFVRLEWDPDGASGHVCLVGKGVTFDTGGISLKSRSGMDRMRYDKGGAAAVFGAVLAVAELELPVRVTGLCPLVENMPGGSAVKPGDVIRMRSGSTVDVLNTDAEGRLILADALDVAKEVGADHTVTLATLTGAVKSALGTQAAAVMGNDEELVKALREAGEAASEPAWPLPFYDAYGKQLEGGVGDIKNVGGKNAGCITAGKFLEHFAPEASWAHLDIAGVAWNDDKPHLNGAYVPEGATGAPMRLLLAWLEELSA